jgi:hypothetical protein
MAINEKGNSKNREPNRHTPNRAMVTPQPRMLISYGYTQPLL